jgi:hypothetical protein
LPRSRFEVRGSRFEVRGSRFEVRGSRFEVRGSTAAYAVEAALAAKGD